MLIGGVQRAPFRRVDVILREKERFTDGIIQIASHFYLPLHSDMMQRLWSRRRVPRCPPRLLDALGQRCHGTPRQKGILHQRTAPRRLLKRGADAWSSRHCSPLFFTLIILHSRLVTRSGRRKAGENRSDRKRTICVEKEAPQRDGPTPRGHNSLCMCNSSRLPAIGHANTRAAALICTGHNCPNTSKMMTILYLTQISTLFAANVQFCVVLRGCQGAPYPNRGDHPRADGQDVHAPHKCTVVLALVASTVACSVRVRHAMCRHDMWSHVRLNRIL